MLPHLLEILLVGQEAIQSYYPPVQIILILNGSPLVIKQWGYTTWTEGGNPVNVTLPLPFPKNNYLIVACAYGGLDNFHTAALNTVTSNITSNAKYQLASYDYNRRYNYIAIGF